MRVPSPRTRRSAVDTVCNGEHVQISNIYKEVYQCFKYLYKRKYLTEIKGGGMTNVMIVVLPVVFNNNTVYLNNLVVIVIPDQLPP